MLTKPEASEARGSLARAARMAKTEDWDAEGDRKPSCKGGLRFLRERSLRREQTCWCTEHTPGLDALAYGDKRVGAVPLVCQRPVPGLGLGIVLESS